MRVRVPQKLRLMREEDYRFHWIIPEDTWWLRLWAWVYYEERGEATTCALFWGYLLMLPLGLPLRLLVASGSGAGGVVGALRREAREARSARQKDEEQPRQEEVRPYIECLRIRVLADRKVSFDLYDRQDVLTNSVEWGRLGGARGWSSEDYPNRYWFLPDESGVHELVVRYRNRRGEPREVRKTVVVHARPYLANRAVKAVALGVARVVVWFKNPLPGRILGGVLLAVAAGFGGPSAVRVTPSVAGWLAGAFGTTVGAVGAVLGWVGDGFPGIGKAVPYVAGVGGGFVGAALVSLVVYVLVTTGALLALRNVLALPAARGTKRGTLGFFKMLLLGLRAVKANTCPRVVVEKGSRGSAGERRERVGTET